MDTKNAAIVEVPMLIRKPVSIVFEALVDPTITTNFWFTKSSGKLAEGESVIWDWEMYGVSVEVKVKELTQNQKICTEWGDPATQVDYEFTPLTDSSTYVVIRHYGFNQTGDELIHALKDSTGGFTSLLDGMKAYLEFGIGLNLTADKYPKELTQHGQ